MLEIIKSDNNILRKKSKRVSKIDDTIRNLANDMISTMKYYGGVGLASPQCGILKQIIVVLINQEPKVFINPEITNTSKEKEVGEEGCLSIPETFIKKERYSQITIKYRDLKGHPHLETYEGFTARVIQHEIDHLYGILMTSDTFQTVH
jgi:peptide deformylase